MSRAPTPSTARHVPQHRRRRPGSKAGHRADIEGLRGIAVLAVVLYHARIGWLGGGFVGVDVFYVISGFLITDLLWRELVGRGRLGLAAFYARRARRLLPAAMLVLAATMVASAELLPPLTIRSVWKDGLWSALYMGNFRFAASRVNYLADPTPSPFQHFWSLGVEEQFYLLWPALLLVAAFGVWGRPSRRRAIGVLSLVTGGSVVLAVLLTRADQPFAFYLLPARAWELGLGGLIALGAPRLRTVPHVVAATIGWLGLAAIAVAAFAYGNHTAYPGTAALLPVGGSGAVVLSGLVDSAAGPVVLLGRAGLRALGRVSYSWYLWHYPVLILGPDALGTALPAGDRLGLVGLSLALAGVTFHFVEDPARRSGWLATSPARSLFGGGALSAGAAAVCLVTALSAPSLAGHGIAPVAVIHQPGGTPLPPAPSAAPVRVASPAPPTTVDPLVAALRSGQSQVEAAIRRSAAAAAVPANLDPSLTAASASVAAPMVDGCLLSYTDTVEPPCLFGNPSGTRSIVLFGDSHASMWFPAVDPYATAHGDRLYVRTKSACPPVDVTLFSPVLGRTWSECSEWRAGVLAWIAQLRPTLVILAMSPNYDSAYDVVQDGPSWLAGLAAVVSAIRADGAAVLVIGPVPAPTADVPDCLSAHLGDATACDFSPEGRRVPGGGLVGIDRPGGAAEAATATHAGATYADVGPLFCTPGRCPVIVDNLLVYRDVSHVTEAYADYLEPIVVDEIGLSLEAGRPAGHPPR